MALWACLGLVPVLQEIAWYPWMLQVVGQPGSGIVGTVFYPCLRATIALVCASGVVWLALDVKVILAPPCMFY